MSESLVLDHNAVAQQPEGFESVNSDLSVVCGAQASLRADLGFVDVSEALQGKAHQLAEQQNALALHLLDYPVGTAVILNQDAWYLESCSDDGLLRIVRARHHEGRLSGASHRFGTSLAPFAGPKGGGEMYLDGLIYSTASAALMFESLPLMSVPTGVLIGKMMVTDVTNLMQTMRNLVDELHAAAVLRGSAHQAPAIDDCDTRLGRCLEMIQQMRTVASDAGVLPILDCKLRKLGGVPNLWRYGSRNAQTAQKLRLVIDSSAAL